MQVLGLFPLHIVLFPNASYPLHIFEERYRHLIGESIAEKKEFGINLVEGGRMYDIGCRVRVSRILKDYPDGRKDIVVSGSTRYRVARIRPSEQLYITADVEDYLDDTDDIDIPMRTETVGLYNELIERVYGSAGKKIDAESLQQQQVAYRIAQKSGLDLLLRQRLLEMTSENERLAFLKLHLKSILPKIRKADQIRLLSRNDGYIE